MTEKSKTNLLKDILIPAISIVASFSAAYISYSSSQKIANLQQQLEQKKFRLDVYVKSYELVQKAVENNEPAAADFARRVIALLDDSEIKNGLYAYLAEKLISAENEIDAVQKQDLQVIVDRINADKKVLAVNEHREKQTIESSSDSMSLNLSDWRVQVLYCTDKQNALTVATDLATLITDKTSAHTYLTTVDLNTKMNVFNSDLNINYTSSDNHEKSLAEGLEALLNTQESLLNGARFILRPVNSKFPYHMSIYVCI